jgi:hypothetical protein
LTKKTGPQAQSPGAAFLQMASSEFALNNSVVIDNVRRRLSSGSLGSRTDGFVPALAGHRLDQGRIRRTRSPEVLLPDMVSCGSLRRVFARADLARAAAACYCTPPC